MIDESIELLESSIWQVKSTGATACIYLGGILDCRHEGKEIYPDEFDSFGGLEDEKNCLMFMEEVFSGSELRASRRSFFSIFSVAFCSYIGRRESNVWRLFDSKCVLTLIDEKYLFVVIVNEPILQMKCL